MDPAVIEQKDSGRLACSWYNYATEQKAMRAAVDFMRERDTPIDRRPADWQLEQLAEHQQQRRSEFKSVQSAQLFWTRDSNGFSLQKPIIIGHGFCPWRGLKSDTWFTKRISGSTASYGDGTTMRVKLSTRRRISSAIALKLKIAR